jgi:hypothetical protein
MGRIREIGPEDGNGFPHRAGGGHGFHKQIQTNSQAENGAAGTESAQGIARSASGFVP